MLTKELFRTYRIAFAGSSELSANHLKSLLGLKCNIIAILTKPIFSNNKLYERPSLKIALEYNIDSFQSLGFNEDLFRIIKPIKADVIIVVSYGLSLPTNILRLPRFGCINIHYSLLPRWKGSAPIQRAIYSGDNKTGVSIIQMDNGIDDGPILLKKPCIISYNDNAISLSRKLVLISIRLLRGFLLMLFSGNIRYVYQDEMTGVYANKVYIKEGLLSWCLPAFILESHSRAFIGWPGSFLYVRNLRIKIIEAYGGYVEYKANLLKAGLVLAVNKRGIYIATGFGVLAASKIQLEGRSVISVNGFINTAKKAFNSGDTVA
ncbi:methionyl-tRNA formyltransferase [Candidatus Tremblaya phenacola]|uniref:Methionyl-tRNA formyltransferase n=1 Tax=Candidatus Tremblayella phenacoccinincola TaxID=1010676 RepID=A0A2G0V7C3_9PROT|nr:methionyl-tRNA formyltransferase [Candidatus Tremblaya phenacola]PHN16352.1 Methionyl-tRNA formyltransferase [Candidatus Tremblaya phenacola]